MRHEQVGFILLTLFHIKLRSFVAISGLKAKPFSQTSYTEMHMDNPNISKVLETYMLVALIHSSSLQISCFPNCSFM